MLGVLLLIVKYPVASLMTRGEEDVLKHTIDAMSVYSISVIPWAVFQVILGVFQGYGKTKYNLYISFIRVYLSNLSQTSTFQIYRILIRIVNIL